MTLDQWNTVLRVNLTGQFLCARGAVRECHRQWTGGAALAQELPPAGKRILLLERDDFLPRSPANWSSQTVFVDGAYQAEETWYGRDGHGLARFVAAQHSIVVI